MRFTFDIDENGKIISNKNRGMSLEDEISKSNNYYLENHIAVIYKKATPIRVVKCVNNKITEAYFEQKSTTDFNGVFNGFHIDFEAKNTNNKTSFPLANILDHQIEHCKNIIIQKGISFFIIEFSSLNRYFLVPSIKIINYIKSTKASSISLKRFINNTFEIERRLKPPLDYLKIVNEHYSSFFE